MSNLIWKPHPGVQEKFHTCPAFEVLYGGAAGGGKSASLLMEATKFIKFPDYSFLLLRRKFTQLSKAGALIDESHRYYPSLGGKWSGEKRRWTFPSGAVGEFGHMEYESNKYDYQSASYQYVGFDEVTHFSETQFTYLISRCRSTNPNIPKRVRAATNPGNIGHVWCKKRFVENKQPFTIYKDKDGNTRCFIPATVYDNPTLCKNDPEYVKRLELLPDKERKMLLYGDWNVFEGMYFDEWNPELHTCKPFSIPNNWLRMIGIDYGYSAPSAVGWYAVDEEGKVWMYRELYEDRLTYEMLARKILDMSGNEKFQYAVGDPAIFGDKPHGTGTIVGESGGETMQKVFGQKLVLFRGDNNRITGWGRCREYLKPRKNEHKTYANFTAFTNCEHFIRTFPQLIHSEINPEDCDSSGEDHLADQLRLALMSRPELPDVEVVEPKLTHDELIMKKAKEHFQKIRDGKRRNEFLGDDY